MSKRSYGHTDTQTHRPDPNNFFYCCYYFYSVPFTAIFNHLFIFFLYLILRCYSYCCCCYCWCWCWLLVDVLMLFAICNRKAVSLKVFNYSTSLHTRTHSMRNFQTQCMVNSDEKHDGDDDDRAPSAM